MKPRGKKQQAKHQQHSLVPRRDTYSNGRAVVNVARLAPYQGLSAPGFLERGYYQDEPFQCQGCGVEQVWTARQQVWWYEVARGDVFTRASRCRNCRRRERERREKAQRVHLEGLAKKAAKK